MNFARSASAPVPVGGDLAASVPSADYPLSGESIVCFAGEDWWYHHPHSKNHLLKRLAKHNRVLFVNSITMGLPSISSPDYFQKIRRKLRSYLRWLRKAPEGLWVMTPINVPLYGSAAMRALNRLLLVLQLRFVMFILNLRHPIVWFANLPPETPADIAAIPRPALGYVGAADWYTMDVPLIEHVARVRPDWHWIFIGSKSNAVQLSAPNIHFLGPKPYSELPRYYRHIDVCVLPWDQHNAFTSYGSAIKVREYLATGKPVVISPLYEYLRMPGVRIYRTTEEFIALVAQALACDTPRERQLRQDAVRDCTWDIRAREVASLFRQLLDGQDVGKAVFQCVGQRQIRSALE